MNEATAMRVVQAVLGNLVERQGFQEVLKHAETLGQIDTLRVALVAEVMKCVPEPTPGSDSEVIYEARKNLMSIARTAGHEDRTKACELLLRSAGR